ncbi:MAG: VIT and VWA domain-containing protein [Gammaproteobacteria bacterium]|nr:VIT and VWA domain-containing protein [Gammaproteobacteria bacterium]
MVRTAAAVLESPGKERVALEGVSVEAAIRGLMAETTVTQTYRNLEAVNIEAVYTFPLPLDAVLLEMIFELDGRRLTGVVRPRGEASEQYEAAVEDGDTAALLEQAAPGLYTVNVGNLMAGERAVVRFRYAQLLRWQGDSLRFFLPTTIAPRYGDPGAAGLMPHQVPEHALTAEHGFSLKVGIDGVLAAAAFECPSHPVAVADHGGRRELSLAGGSALMDRDFVLVLRRPEAAVSQALVARDGEGWVALASFNPVSTAPSRSPPRGVTLVVDCSASMAGDSIAQARNALREITGLLEPTDHFTLIAFGSTHRALFPGLVAATPQNLGRARRFVDGLDADLGGTEIGPALHTAFRCEPPPGLRPAVLLVTDGEVWDQDRVLELARASGQRLFTVGVGSAVSEAFLRRLAETTGGALELVSPREDMAERIVRHFRRMSQPRAQACNVRWPRRPERQAPQSLDTVYAGDTLHVFGWFSEPPTGEVSLDVGFADGTRFLEHAAVSADEYSGTGAAADVLPRIAAWARLAALEAAEARDMAVNYQLVTEQTSCVLVSVRTEHGKADTIPALRKVPQVLAAGWHGVGTVDWQMDTSMEGDECPSLVMPPSCDDFDFDYDMPFREDADDNRREAAADTGLYDPGFDLDFDRYLPASLARLVRQLNARYPERDAALLDLDRLTDLSALALEPALLEDLEELVEQGFEERDVVLALLFGLLRRPEGGGLERHVQRLLHKAVKDASVPEVLQDRVNTMLSTAPLP